MIADISLKQGDGIELVRDVRAHHPQLPILVLSMHDETIYAERMLSAGANGYIMKQAASEQFLVSLRRVLDGGIYVSEAVGNNMIQKFAAGGSYISANPIDRLLMSSTGSGWSCSVRLIFSLSHKYLLISEIFSKIFLHNLERQTFIGRLIPALHHEIVTKKQILLSKPLLLQLHCFPKLPHIHVLIRVYRFFHSLSTVDKRFQLFDRNRRIWFFAE